jgi:hypothetical protein
MTTADVSTGVSGGLAHDTARGPLRGFAGLVTAELRRWFPARALVLALLGSAIAVVVFVVWSSGANADNPRLGSYVYSSFGVWIVLMVLAMVATTQGAMADEIEEGTAAWVIAKPVGRTGFVLSKFVAAVPGVLLGAILIPGIVLRVLIVEAEGRGDTEFSADDVFRLMQSEGEREVFMTLPPLERHLGTLTLLAIVLLFIVAVMILLGCAIRSRAAVFLLGLAVPIGLLVYSILGPAAIVEVTPAWAFDSLLTLIRNDAAPVLAPTVITGAWTIGALAVATAWFSRMEL